MLCESNYPTELFKRDLDDYLADGWFRMGQSIFTTNFLRFNEQIYSAIWLRVDLQRFQKGSTFKKLEKLNARFGVSINKFVMDPAKEALFEVYRDGVSFSASSSLEHLLYSHGTNDIYDTWEISIYDADKLIAVGILDYGDKAAAGISCFYDHDYKKYSLGKYLMYLKMELSQKNGYQYFYPGYFAPHYPLFDYKLSLAPASLEYLDLASGHWLDIEEYQEQMHPLRQIKEKLGMLSMALLQKNILHSSYSYDYFDANLIQALNGHDLFAHPMFIYCYGEPFGQVNPVVVYDVRDGQFHLIQCIGVYKPSPEEPLNPNTYYEYLLKSLQVLFSSDSVAEMSRVIQSVYVNLKARQIDSNV